MKDRLDYDNGALFVGDSKAVLEEIPDESVQCAVTSPPYWGLRDYGEEGQLGLEETPEEYVNNLCDVFDELMCVLRDDGTFWLNLGDSYAKNKVSTGGYSDKSTLAGYTSEETKGRRLQRQSNDKNLSHNLKQKDLVGIPWRVALELQSRGWYLRNDIIWNKPNPMPESVTDRCTTSHEHIFLLTKSKQYYYDQDAIREEPVTGTDYSRRISDSDNGLMGEEGLTDDMNSQIRDRDSIANHPNGKNKNDVWKITTQPFSNAHFAVFPPELPKTCIQAGTDKGDIVLDPFSGAGTTGVTARRLGRKYVGIDLSVDYSEMALDRIQEYEWNEGFPEEPELPQQAQWLTTVEGVGKKTALDIWEHYDECFGDIVNAISYCTITDVDGVGPKTMEKMQVELEMG